MRVFLLLLVGMAVEIGTLIAVGKSVGVLATVGLLILGGVIGSMLLRREGARTMASFTEALRTRRAPHQEVADGVLIAAAGVLVILPGFVSDVVALFLLFPPTRRLVSRRIARRSEERAATAVLNHQYGRPPTAGAVVVDGAVVEGVVVDVQVDPEPRPSGRPELA
ncbi:MAG TPA: FxsA family protein [Umezawaea sp.]|nr:FxsA family protein [Umezawaea sp.]